MLKDSGCRNSTSTDALEVQTNTPPVDLHLKLQQAQEMVRICAKHDEDPIRTYFARKYTSIRKKTYIISAFNEPVHKS